MQSARNIRQDRLAYHWGLFRLVAFPLTRPRPSATGELVHCGIQLQPCRLKVIELDTALSTLIPVAAYQLSRRYFGATEFTGLLVATLYPVVTSLYDLAKSRQMNPVSILVVIGILTSVGALFLGGSPRILLIRESLLTVVLGLTCLISLLFPRPLMFYFGRYFMAGSDRVKVASFNENWGLANVRKTHRLITIVWGCALIAEFSLRTWMVMRLPTATVLSIAPILFNVIILATFIWTIKYARRVQGTLSAQAINEHQS